MKAAVYKRYGPPEVVNVVDLDIPDPGPHDICVRVRAATVNRTDCGFRGAHYFIVRFFSGMWRPKNRVLGCEFSGEVVKVGRLVSRYRTGDRVFAFNDQKFGGHAEYVVIPESGAIAKIPENVSFETAAASIEGAHYALGDLRAARLEAGQSILINGATGAIGSAAVQLAKYFGAYVTAVCHGHHRDLVSSLGADKVIDYSREDFTQLDHQHDVVFDAVGKSSFRACRRILKSKGIYMSTEFGSSGENPLLALLTPVFGGRRVLFPLPSISQADVEFLGSLVARKRFVPVIDRTYPLDSIQEAYRYVETGQKIGNVLVIP